MLVTVKRIGLYPSIPHALGLKNLKNTLDARENKAIPKEKFVKMAKFVLEINFFEFHGTVNKQILFTAISTKCTPSCEWIFLNKFESNFRDS